MKAWFRGKLGAEVETPLVWKPVEKRELLADNSHSLSVERFLGEEASQFETVRVPLGDIATFEYGHTATARDTGNARYIRITDIDEYGCLRPNDAKFIRLDDEAKTCLAQRGDVFVARIGATAGKTLLYTSSAPAVFASYLIRVRLDPEKAIPEFYWCLTRSKRSWEQREQLVSGGGQPQLNANALKLIEIPLPPLEEQRRIVAEIEGHQKVLDGARQILAAGEAQITVDAEWPMVSFEELCERLQYGLSVPLNKNGNGVKTFRMAELVRGRAFDNGSMKCADIDAKEAKKYLLVKGDLLFNRTNSYEHVGRTGIFSLEGEYVFASYLIRLSIKRDLAEPEYVNAWMNTAEFQAGVKSLASRAVGQSNISASSLADYKIPLPPLEEQRRIMAELDAEAAQMEAVRSLIPRFEAKIQRVLDRVWGNVELPKSKE